MVVVNKTKESSIMFKKKKNTEVNLNEMDNKIQTQKGSNKRLFISTRTRR